jgi:hypothetical protein
MLPFTRASQKPTLFNPTLKIARGSYTDSACTKRGRIQHGTYCVAFADSGIADSKSYAYLAISVQLKGFMHKKL